MRWPLALLLLGACDASSGESTSSFANAPGLVDKGPAHVASDVLRRCAEAKGELSSITDAVARMNALLPAADGPCFVATLPRPLAVVATTSVTSAQPAAGTSSPRIFFLLPKVVISAVPDGDGSRVLELGEWVTATRTLKGEVGLPITAPLAPDAAFQRVLQNNDRTTCVACHRGEERYPSIPNAFVSAALKPERGTFVTVSELEVFHETCTREHDASARCAMLHAVFDFGDVTQGTFAPEVETLYTR